MVYRILTQLGDERVPIFSNGIGRSTADSDYCSAMVELTVLGVLSEHLLKFACQTTENRAPFILGVSLKIVLRHCPHQNLLPRLRLRGSAGSRVKPWNGASRP